MAPKFQKGSVSLEVKNTGTMTGKEVVQLYIRDLEGSATRPVKEFKNFQKISLKPGEAKTISFKITEDDLKFYNSALKFVAEPGDFNMFVGGNSRDVTTGKFTPIK